MRILQEIASRVREGNSALVKELIQKALRQEVAAEKILEGGLIPGMDEVGEKFKRNEVFIPEVIIASRAMKSGIEALRPHFSASGLPLRGKVVMATVKGDLHDIGKKIVCLMLEGAAFEVIDLGVDIPKEQLLKSIRDDRPDVVGLSALLTSTMTYMGEIVAAAGAAGLRRKVKVIVGGAPVTASYAEEIEADGYAPDAASAVTLVKNLLSKSRL
jgi:5-methyltetrahydrofolate--homocysteine methyltransferase